MHVLSLFVLSPIDNDVMYGRSFNVMVTTVENYSESFDSVLTDVLELVIGWILVERDHMITLLLHYIYPVHYAAF